jgi:hypothetical protein
MGDTPMTPVLPYPSRSEAAPLVLGDEGHRGRPVATPCRGRALPAGLARSAAEILPRPRRETGASSRRSNSLGEPSAGR